MPLAEETSGIPAITSRPSRTETVRSVATPLTVGQPEPKFPVSHREWKRIRSRVEALRNPLPWAENAAWACVGIAASTLFAGIAWVAAYGSLSTAAQQMFNWVAPAMFITTLAAIALAAILLLVNSKIDSELRREVAKSHV